MSKRRVSLVSILVLALAGGVAPAAQAQQAAAPPPEKPRRAVVTFDGDLEELPALAAADFEIEAGKRKFPPARLYKPEEMPTVLALLLQENQVPEFGTQLPALRDFILAQPANTYIGVFYLSGQSVEPAILFDANLQKVAEVLRTPKGQQELAPPSPYASIANMVTYMAQLPDARKEILWFAEGSDPSAGGASDTQNRALAQAVELAQKAGVPVFVVYCSALPPPSQLRGDSNPSAAGIPPTPGSPRRQRCRQRLRRRALGPAGAVQPDLPGAPGRAHRRQGVLGREGGDRDPPVPGRVPPAARPAVRGRIPPRRNHQEAQAAAEDRAHQAPPPQALAASGNCRFLWPHPRR